MSSFDLDHLQRQLSETEDYLKADTAQEQQTVLRRSLTLRNSNENILSKSTELKPQSFENTSSNSQLLRNSLNATLLGQNANRNEYGPTNPQQSDEHI